MQVWGSARHSNTCPTLMNKWGGARGLKGWPSMTSMQQHHQHANKELENWGVECLLSDASATTKKLQVCQRRDVAFYCISYRLTDGASELFT